MSRGPQRGTDLAGSKRHRTQPHPGCLEYGVADRRGHDRAGFAATPRSLVRPVNEVDDDVRDLGKGQDRVASCGASTGCPRTDRGD